MTRLFILMLLTCVSATAGDKARVQVTVLLLAEEWEAVVAQQEIVFDSSNAKFSGRTNEEGQVILELPPGRYSTTLKLPFGQCFSPRSPINVLQSTKNIEVKLWAHICGIADGVEIDPVTHKVIRDFSEAVPRFKSEKVAKFGEDELWVSYLTEQLSPSVELFVSEQRDQYSKATLGPLTWMAKTIVYEPSKRQICLIQPYPRPKADDNSNHCFDLENELAKLRTSTRR